MKALILSLWLTLAAFARAETNGLSSLWVIEGPTNKVYLQASIHLLKPEHYPLNSAIDAAFSNSQVIVFEADIGEVNTAETSAFIMSRSMLGDDQSLSSVLTPDTHSSVKDILKELGMDIAEFEIFKPWFLSVTLSTLKLQSLGFSPRYGVDFHFYQRALKQKKTIVSLESVEDQISVLDSLSAEDQDAMLTHTIRELSETETVFLPLVKAWQAGNSQPLEEMVLEAYEEFPELYRQMIADRNKSWLPRLEAYAKSPENHMVIVGAAHMVGKDSLLKLLSSKGYSIRQL